MTPPETANLLKAVLRRPVAYHRVFAEITGKVSAGLMLSQAWYWTPRTDNEDGWFYKTRAEWTDETGMTRTEQETARKRLVTLGLMDEALKGMPGKMHFRVNTERLVSLLAENLPTGRRKTYQQLGRKAANMKVEKLPTSITESTQETTKEMSAYALLFDKHYKRVGGDVRKPEAQGKAIKEMIALYPTEKILACYDFQLQEPWRKGHVDWLTVRERIGEFETNGNGHKPDRAVRDREIAERMGYKYE